ncbi:MAG: carboxylesterase family protein [Pseudoxanthomonas sp.]
MKSKRLAATCFSVSLLLLTGNATAAAKEAAPVVRIAQGKLQGVEENGIAVFRGIPFAGDTGGEHRWKPPTPAPSWKGLRKAAKAGAICPQSTQARNGVVAPWLAHFSMSEDCLNLNVYRPALAKGEQAPVMVWIHGGFARIGTGSRHDGKDLAQQGMVVVTINYRLDRLGLFAHPALSAEQPDAALGNYALLDMLAALRWVQDNIASFGGDPDKVTIFGQSSGGIAVSALMGSPMSRGLFQRAIAQSGVMADLDHERRLAQDLPGSPSLESDGVAMAQALLPKTSNVGGAELRALPWQELVAYTAKQPASALVPVVDGKVLVRPVAATFAAGEQQPVPFMVGSTSWEQSLYVNFNLPKAAILAGVPAQDTDRLYPGLEDKALVNQWLADTGFHAPGRFLADGSARHGQPTWVYRFDHIPPAHPQQPGAAHSDDVPYLFTPIAAPGWPADNPTEQKMAAMMLGYWTQFARTGNPNGPGLPAWPAWQAGGNGATQLLDVPASTQAGLWKARMDYHHARYQKALDTAKP